LKKLTKALGVTFFTAIAIFMILPLVYMAMMSMTPNMSTAINTRFSEYGFTNYRSIFVSMDFLRYFFNTAIVVFGALLLNNLFGAMAGYAFSKKKFPGKTKLYYGIIITMMIPGQVTLIPMFIMASSLSLNDTLFILMIPIINAFSVFFMTQSMMSLPDDMLEAARIDGANEAKTFLYIVLPLARFAIVSLSIFSFITVWNDFLWPLVMISDSSKRTMTLAVAMLRTNYAVNYGLMMAGSVLVFLPPFIAYCLLQKRFVESISMSGIKA